jgi:pyruvate/2-oxoglutarate dehydrogenase complex dihydrolipoamide dehydrogenase (E3) component
MSRVRPEINVHPRVLLPSALKQREFDVVVIGGGPAGETTAVYCVKGGLTALLVESELVGGECPYWACVPSKALLRPSEAVGSAKAVGGAREKLVVPSKNDEETHPPEIDLAGTWAARDRFVKRWDDQANVMLMQSSGVEVVHGFGSVVGPKTVAVKDWHSGVSVNVTARSAVVIATGSEPIIPEIDGIEDVGYWTPREAVSAAEVPSHLIVVGAGAVGCEIATAYRQFGATVTLISSGSSILPKVRGEAAAMVRDSMQKAGIHVRLSARVTAVVRRGKKSVEVTLADGSVIAGSDILIAAGRRARTVGMGLKSVGGPEDGTSIDVDLSMCAVAVPDGWLYAVGDTNGLAPLTHVGRYQAIIASQSVVAKARGTYEKALHAEKYLRLSRQPSEHAIPQVIFTDPQVAYVGLFQVEAEAQGIKSASISCKMQGPGSSLHGEGYLGWAEWVIEQESGRIIGATFAGPDVADLLHASTVAIVGKLSWRQMFHAIPSFPTLSEVYHNLVEKCASI